MTLIPLNVIHTIDGLATVGTPIYDEVCADLQTNPDGGPIPPRLKVLRPRDDHGRFTKTNQGGGE